jgi:SHS2 domain-containing protein
MPAKRPTKQTTTGYRFLPDVATADVCFEAEGKDLDELFASAALATEEVMVDLKTVKPAVSREIRLENKDIGNLLYDLLEELVFLKDKDLLLFSRFKLQVKEAKGRHVLTGTMHGEPIDKERHKLMCDVKAVTLHMFTVERTAKGWKARVVLDI